MLRLKGPDWRIAAIHYMNLAFRMDQNRELRGAIRSESGVEDLACMIKKPAHEVLSDRFRAL